MDPKSSPGMFSRLSRQKRSKHFLPPLRLRKGSLLRSGFFLLAVLFLVYACNVWTLLSHLDRLDHSTFHNLTTSIGAGIRSLETQRTGKLLQGSWSEHVSLVEKWLLPALQLDKPSHVGRTSLKPITAFLEPPLNATIPGTGEFQPPSEGKGIPPKYYEPLPLRTQTPDDLQKVVYPKVFSCNDLPAFLPVDEGVQFDPATGSQIVTNVGEQLPEPDFLQKITPYCPVDADPFLPWIHDVFLDQTRSKVQFVAHNKRRCQTGSKHRDDILRLQPQVALLQSVSVQRISSQRAARLAPQLWQPINTQSTWYRLASYEQADHDAMYTRFICRFHTWTTTPSASDNHRVELGETMSEYDFNYELVSYRRGKHLLGSLSYNGKDNPKLWTSTLLFSCPLPSALKKPKPHDMQWVSSTGDIPLVHVDIVPIRTPVRYPNEQDGGYYLSQELVGAQRANSFRFRASKAWGDNHVLPSVEASGRWQNLPICPISTKDTPSLTSGEKAVLSEKSKPYLLTACVWTSSSFLSRGRKNQAIDDTDLRIMEWIEFHLMVGFDHIYVYDNSGAFGNSSSLANVTDMFPSSQVTRIDWPSKVCNNNIPAHDNTGERSSQYAAENSCRVRFGPLTEWMTFIDTDEYLVPQGTHTSLRTIVKAANESNILSFKSTRGKLRLDYCHGDGRMLQKKANTTFLQAFNCDSSSLPKPESALRARKQLYRTDYVVQHFVHYATATKGFTQTFTEANGTWVQHFEEDEPSEREIDELREAVMIHAKHIGPDMTQNWRGRCKYNFKGKTGCYIGFPWPDNVEVKSDPPAHDTETGLIYNCFLNQRIDSFWAPQLEQAIARRKAVDNRAIRRS